MALLLRAPFAAATATAAGAGGVAGAPGCSRAFRLMGGSYLGATSAARLRHAPANWLCLQAASKHQLRPLSHRRQFVRRESWPTASSTWPLCGLASSSLELPPRRVNQTSQMPTLTATCHSAASASPAKPASTGTDATTTKTPPSAKAPLDSRGAKRVKINACGALYERLADENPLWYRAAPRGTGIDFEVDYYDSLELLPEEARSKAPIVCLLHGAPGHYSDFSDLIRFLTAKGCRVLGPCYPSHEAVFQHSFRHSPAERADYLKSFFKALKVNSVDLLVGHSTSVFTIFELLTQTLEREPGSIDAKLQVRSVALFSALSYQLPANIDATFWRMLTLKMFDFPLLRPMLVVLVQSFRSLVGIKNRFDKMDNMVIMGSAVGFSSYPSLEERLELVRRHKVPTFVTYGCRDRIISADYFEQLIKRLGVLTDQVKTYNAEGRQVGPSWTGHRDLVQVTRYLDGGHYAFQRYSRQVNEDLYAFLVKNQLVIEGK